MHGLIGMRGRRRLASPALLLSLALANLEHRSSGSGYHQFLSGQGKCQISPYGRKYAEGRLKDTLMAHVDRSEMSSTSPLVSIS
jgi:hypothetical protein